MNSGNRNEPISRFERDDAKEVPLKGRANLTYKRYITKFRGVRVDSRTCMWDLGLVIYS